MSDLQHLAEALEKATPVQRQRLLVELATTPFLVARSAATGEMAWCKPQVAYWPEPHLVDYFAGYNAAWLLGDVYVRWRSVLTEVGVRSDVPVKARRQNSNGFVVLLAEHGQHARGMDGFDPDATIEGLEHALGNPNLERSRFIWNDLLPRHRRLLSGVVEKATRQTYEGATRADCLSPIGEAARRAAWLPDRSGSWHPPNELVLDDLPDGYRRDEELARALAMVVPVVEEASRELGVPARVLHHLSEHPEEVQRLMEQLTLPQIPEQDPEVESPPGEGAALDYASELASAFSRPSKRGADDEMPSVSSEVANPDFRRDRTSTAIDEAREAERARASRFREVPRRVWEGKDSAARGFILEQYGGRCQICDASFARRDGSPYFDAMFLVSHVKAAWIDRPGNLLSLCPTCRAKMQHAALEAEDFVEQILAWRSVREGGDGDASVRIALCGRPERIGFTERHLLDLQEMIKGGLGAGATKPLLDG